MSIADLQHRCTAPPAVASAIAGFDAIANEPERRAHVQRLARHLRAGLSIDADPLEASVPIVPVILGEDDRAVRVSERLAE